MIGHTDGNSLAGALASVFRFDPTTAVGCCSGCGDTRTLAASVLYSEAIGDVLRCPGCDTVLLTLVRSPQGVSLSTSGLSWVRFPEGPGS